MITLKRNLVARVVAPMGVALVALMIGASPNAYGADISGTGQGSVNFGSFERFVTFEVSARTNASGDVGQFRFTIDNPQPLDAHVNVDCLNVFPLASGAGGWVSGAVDKVSPEPNAYNIHKGTRLLVYMADFGGPGDPVADEFLGSLEIGSCKALGPSSGHPITQGNININLP